ncbi:MAG: hypothetical protein MUF19_03780 [Candidatus Pacebacteria bacterium]|jgi:hypothetical protein|nr:hypothetical protein [Candidatus Paceibacterota bacterium]
MKILESTVLIILQHINIAFLTGLAFVVIPSLVMLLTLTCKFSDKIEIANLLIQVVVAISAGFAVVTYFEKRDEKKLRLALETINFYRENILRAQNDIFAAVVTEKGINYEFPKAINFDTTNLKSETLTPDVSSKKAYLDFLGIKSIEAPHVTLLNSMEEFSLRVRAFKLQNYSVMQTIKESFVQIVEHGGLHRIAQVRAAGTSEHSFKEILLLYEIWRHEVSRKSEKERINAFFQKEIIK